MKKSILIKRNTENGFTLFETLLVIALISILSAGALMAFTENRTNAQLESAQAMIVQTLEKARNESFTGMDGSKHGVKIESNKIIYFKGDDFASATASYEIPFPAFITISSTDPEVVFDRLSGLASNLTTDLEVDLNHLNGGNKEVKVAKDGFITND